MRGGVRILNTGVKDVKGTKVMMMTNYAKAPLCMQLA